MQFEVITDIILCMIERLDLRTLTGEQLFVVRKQIVRLKRMGKSGAEVYELSGVTAPAEYGVHTKKEG